MEKKKTKLKLSGNLKRSISNIERAKTQGSNSVVIEKKKNKFSSKKQFNTNRLDQYPKKSFNNKFKPINKEKPSLPVNDFEKENLLNKGPQED